MVLGLSGGLRYAKCCILKASCVLQRWQLPPECNLPALTCHFTYSQQQFDLRDTSLRSSLDLLGQHLARYQQNR
jgi:hypothetical protein